MKNNEREAVLDRLLAEQLRANTLSAGHYVGLQRLPGKKKPTQWGKAVLAAAILVSSFVIYQGLVS